MAYDDSSASGQNEPWIRWFCGLKGHEMFCEVERSYIEDGFNLYGLRACVANFSDCLDLILDRIGPDDSDDSHLTQSACTLYGLIHARYIITSHGLDAMYNKYANKDFGTCPLTQCYGQPVLPVGLKDEMGSDTVKIFCPKCLCVYHPPPIRFKSHHSALDDLGNASVDGASFGTTFPHLFLMTFNNLVPDALSPESAYVPRVFGFRVHQSAKQRYELSGANSAASANARTSRRTSVAVMAAAAAVAESTGTNGNGFKTADVDAVDASNTNTEELAQSLEKGSHEDNIASTSARVENDHGTGSQIKGSTSKGSGKNKKSARGKSEDSGSSSKRKVKNLDTSADAKGKRPKRNK